MQWAVHRTLDERVHNAPPQGTKVGRSSLVLHYRYEILDCRLGDMQTRCLRAVIVSRRVLFFHCISLSIPCHSVRSLEYSIVLFTCVHIDITHSAVAWGLSHNLHSNCVCRWLTLPFGFPPPQQSRIGIRMMAEHFIQMDEEKPGFIGVVCMNLVCALSVDTKWPGDS